MKTNRRHSATPGASPRRRNALAALLSLSLLSAAAPLPRAAAAAGQESAPAGKSYPAAPPDQGNAFIVISDNGSVVCRDATPAERARILRRDPSVRTTPVGRGRGRVADELPAAGASDAGSKTGGAAAGSAAASDSTTAAAGAGLDIVLRATQQLQANPAALAAFERAAADWEALITTQITVVLDVDFGPTRFGEAYGERTLGSTSGGVFYVPPYTDVRQRLINNASTAEETGLYNSLPAGSLPTDLGAVTQMAVASPVARALGAIGPHANPNDTTGNDRLGSAPSIGFNSNFTFDFDHRDGVTAGQTDFHSVAVHEIGHALGFTSQVGVRELNPQATLRASIWDLFRFRPATAAGAFSTAQRVLSSGATSSDRHVHYDGAAEVELSTARPDHTGGDGEQASHWKDDRLIGFFIGVMDPTIPRGVHETMTANDRRAVNFFGYSTGAAPPPPANDNFADAASLAGSAGTAAGTNVNSTREQGEPNHAGVSGGRSVWYTWTAPASGQVNINTAGSSYDTVLAVYIGGAVGALAAVASNDDVQDGVNRTSAVSFNASAGAVYRVAVDGYDGDTGSFTVNWSLAAAPTPTPTPTPTPAPTPTTTVSGRVVDAQGNGVGGVLIGIVGPMLPNFSATTDANGNYAFQNAVVNASYTVTPIRNTGLAFTPDSAAVVAGAAESVNFTTRQGNPIDGTQFFVSQHYRDFLSREPDAGGLAFWSNGIEGCGVDLGCRQARRVNTSAAFFLSIEFQETGYLVYRFYKAAHGNLSGRPVPVRREDFVPDTQRIGQGVQVGVGDWQTQLEANKTAFAQEFVARARFLSEYPSTMTAAEFVDRLNANAGGVLTADERSQLVAELGPNPADASLRARVLRRVAENAELSRREFNKAFVLMQYFGYLRRNPDDAPDADYSGWQFWLDQLNRFNGDFQQAQMVRAFIESIEYNRRFAP